MSDALQLLGLFLVPCFSLFFFNVPATTDIYTLSLHDALPILRRLPSDRRSPHHVDAIGAVLCALGLAGPVLDRKSTRLNSSHTVISYAVFCLKKKKANLNRIMSMG